MKRSRSFILILICGLFQVTALGQNEFIKVESNEDQPLYSIEFGDEMVGYIGGANATLLKNHKWREHMETCRYKRCSLGI